MSSSLKDVAFQEMLTRFDMFLQNWLNNYQNKIPPENQKLITAIKYALKGGKRFRVLLVLSVAKSLQKDMDIVLPFACGVELLHTYSLIHDDLPAMDNALERRGRPSLHKAFDEATAILAGDTLLTEAFPLIAHPSLHTYSLIELLVYAVGGQGMISGQMMDLQAENHSHLDLEKLYSLKTGALITASVVGAATLLKTADLTLLHLKKFAQKLGIAFQIADDLEDFDSIDSTNTPSINCVHRWGFKTACKKLQDYSLKALDNLNAIAMYLDINYFSKLVHFNIERSGLNDEYSNYSG